jgi:hypothetical protein
LRFSSLILCLALALISFNASASLDDDFIYSSKFGLSTESVTTSWKAEENGLIFGGKLNGVPRDTWHENYFLNGKLAKVVIGYDYDPLNFESESAARKWSILAAKSIISKANRKYGLASESSFKCQNEVKFTDCGGKVVWRGARKVFEITAFEMPLSDVMAAYTGFDGIIQLTFSYSSAEHYDMLSARLPHLVKQRIIRNGRRTRSLLNSELKYYFRERDMTLDEFIMKSAESRGKINEILRKGSVMYTGGVKANYLPDKWARSFRLQ